MKTLHLAGCIIPDAEGKILLLHRNTPKRTQWEIPGGKIEEGEEPAVSAAREVLEELGIEVEILKELDTQAFTEDDFTMKYTWFTAKHQSGEPTIKEPQTHDAFDFFHIDNWGDIVHELSPNAANFLQAVQSGHLTLE